MTTSLTPPLSEQDHRLGPMDAPVTLVEYGDYECPYCGMAFPIVNSIIRQMGDHLQFAFRQFPLSRVHPHAEHAAEMAEAAGSRHAFWAMHNLLYQHQDALEDEDLIAYAGAVGIDAQWAATALATHRFVGRVREHFISGVRSGVNGTPTFFINGVRHDGGWDEPTLLATLQAASAAGVRR
ncbi:MAG TPA: DsbA family protein [Gemmatimonadales bacterium]|nr:DsbA family protein [Gemmatimonadales bacterium]